MNAKHPHWYYTFGLIVPLLAVFLPWMIWDKFSILNGVSQPFKAVVLGGVVAAISYLGMTMVLKEPRPLSQAILAGLLAAEIMVFSGGAFPNMATVTLWLFFYYNAILNSHSPH